MIVVDCPDVVGAGVVIGDAVLAFGVDVVLFKGNGPRIVVDADAFGGGSTVTLVKMGFEVLRTRVVLGPEVVVLLEEDGVEISVEELEALVGPDVGTLLLCSPPSEPSESDRTNLRK